MSNPETVARIAGLTRRAAPRCGATRILAIDGPAGSGKTTLAEEVAPQLQATVVHMDDLYEGWDGLAESGDLLRHRILMPLSRHRPGAYRRYDWPTRRRAETRKVAAGGHLVIEGVGSVRMQTREFYSTIVWVQASDDLRLERSLARDGAAAEPYLRRWMHQEWEVFTATGTPQLADIHVDAWGRIIDESPRGHRR